VHSQIPRPQQFTFAANDEMPFFVHIKATWHKPSQRRYWPLKCNRKCEHPPAKRNYAKRRHTVLERTNENVADRVAALVRKMLDREKFNKAVGADDDLRGSGLSSIGLVNLMLSVESEFDLTIPERDMTPGNFRSITRIAELVDTVSQRPATG
jgi:acyl carrier protein